jgi:hypothetical protein
MNGYREDSLGDMLRLVDQTNEAEVAFVSPSAQRV